MDLRPAVSFICSHLWVKCYTLISSRITTCLLFRIQMCVDAIILFAETRISKQLKMRQGGKIDGAVHHSQILEFQENRYQATEYTEGGMGLGRRTEVVRDVLGGEGRVVS